MIELKKHSLGLTRRQFLRNTFLALAGAVAAPIPRAGPALAQVPAPLPSEDPVHVYFRDLAQMLRARGRTDSFEPAGIFDRPFFERARNATFVLNAGLYPGTAFLTARKADEWLFATSRHVFPVSAAHYNEITVCNASGNESVRLQSWVPGSNGIDVVIVRCRESYPLSRSLPNELKVSDSYSPRVGDEVLVLGFPNEFLMPDYYITYAKVLRVNAVREGYWTLSGLIHRGMSGSPVLTRAEGIPNAIGVVWGMHADSETVYCSSIDTTIL